MTKSNTRLSKKVNKKRKDRDAENSPPSDPNVMESSGRPVSQEQLSIFMNLPEKEVTKTSPHGLIGNGPAFGTGSTPQIATEQKWLVSPAFKAPIAKVFMSRRAGNWIFNVPKYSTKINLPSKLFVLFFLQ